MTGSGVLDQLTKHHLAPPFDRGYTPATAVGFGFDRAAATLIEVLITAA